MDMQELARQLRTPEGELGITVGNNMNVGNGPMYKLSLPLLALKAGDKVLEVGFGNGKHISSILDVAPDITYQGIDISPLMVKEATDHLNNSGLTAKALVREGAFSSLEYTGQSFDAALTINTIYFLKDPIGDLKQLWKVMKMGGRVVISFRPKAMVEKLPFTKYGFTLYDLQQVKSMLAQAGFRDISEMYQEEAPTLFLGEQIAFSCYAVKAIK